MILDSESAVAPSLGRCVWTESFKNAGDNAPTLSFSVALVGDRLYRFGGRGVETWASGAVEYVDVAAVWKHAEGGTTPLTSGWTWEEVPLGDGAKAPSARANAGVVPVTTGQGRMPEGMPNDGPPEKRQRLHGPTFQGQYPQ